MPSEHGSIKYLHTGEILLPEDTSGAVHRRSNETEDDHAFTGAHSCQTASRHSGPTDVDEPLDRARRVLELAVSLVAMHCLPVFTGDPDAYAGIVVTEFNESSRGAILSLRGSSIALAAALYDTVMPVARGGCTATEPATEVRLVVDGTSLSSGDLRNRDTIDINTHFGAPGEELDTPEGEALMLATLRACGGVGALTNVAVEHLATAHGARVDELAAAD